MQLHAFLHVIERDYDRARHLYSKAIEYMVRRGPDNAFVLLSYAMFLASTCEDDFENILDLVERARLVDPELNVFPYAEAGYFRQATILCPNNAQALCNYAICLQFYGTVTSLRKHPKPDLELSQFYYIRALKLDPYDIKIVQNFDFMLKHIKGSNFDAYDCFMNYQTHEAKANISMWQNEITVNGVIEVRNSAAILLQKTFRGFITRRNLATGNITPDVSWKSNENAVLIEAQQYLGNDFLAIAKRLPGRSPIDVKSRLSKLSNQDSPPDENTTAWEMFKDDDENIFYYNAESGISSWTIPSTEGREYNQNTIDTDNGIWESHFDDNGNQFWYNTVTNESQWELPVQRCEEDVKEKVEVNPLWEICQDVEGNMFYYNTMTQQSVWNLDQDEASYPNVLQYSNTALNSINDQAFEIYNIGDFVYAQYDGGEHWYPGRVAGFTSELYCILYDDGDYEERVPKEHICIRNPPKFNPNQPVFVNTENMSFSQLHGFDKGVIGNLEQNRDTSIYDVSSHQNFTRYSIIYESGSKGCVPPTKLFLRPNSN